MVPDFVVCLNVLEASCSNSVDPDQTAPIGAVWSGSTLVASVLESVNNVSKYLQQTTSADVVFSDLFCRHLKGEPDQCRGCSLFI